MPSTSLCVLHRIVVVLPSMPALQRTSRKRVSVLVLVTLASSNGFWCYNTIVMMLYRLISVLMIAGELILCLYIVESMTTECRTLWP